ncbi:MAG: lipopolysaccharide kinase InaA family protein [Planctomycetota bacterium]|jgi:hypothetical protein
MSPRTLRPAANARLLWTPPAATSAEAFAAVRPRLEALVTAPEASEMYAAKRRSLYRARDEVLGPVAIKEIRSGSLARRLWFRRFREHPALREFRVGSAFEARGGLTAGFLGAAVERGRLSLDRVLIFLRWIEGGVTLSEHLRRVGPEPDAELLRRLARALADAAHLGLSHGRHGTENVLVASGPAGEEFMVIDFAYSELHEGFDGQSYVRDVGRLALYAALWELLSRPRLEMLLDEAARAAWPDADAAARGRRSLRAALDAHLRERGLEPLGDRNGSRRVAPASGEAF